MIGSSPWASERARSDAAGSGLIDEARCLGESDVGEHAEALHRGGAGLGIPVNFSSPSGPVPSTTTPSPFSSTPMRPVGVAGPVGRWWSVATIIQAGRTAAARSLAARAPRPVTARRRRAPLLAEAPARTARLTAGTSVRKTVGDEAEPRRSPKIWACGAPWSARWVVICRGVPIVGPPGEPVQAFSHRSGLRRLPGVMPRTSHQAARLGGVGFTGPPPAPAPVSVQASSCRSITPPGAGPSDPSPQRRVYRPANRIRRASLSSAILAAAPSSIAP